MAEESKIKKALRRLEGAEVKVICRGGEIVKIPTQEVEMQELNNAFFELHSEKVP